MEDSETTVDKGTAVSNTLDKLNELNEKYLQTANSEADVHLYNAVQSMLHATALKLYDYTENDRDYKIEADLHLLVAQLEYLRLLESAASAEKTPDSQSKDNVVLIPQGPRIEYTDQRQHIVV